MEVLIQKDERSACLLVARIIARRLRAKPGLVLGLATGHTMEGVYAELARMHKQDKLDFSRCRTFNLDEYVGLTPEDPHSYHYYMKKNLFDKVNINPRNTHVPDGTTADFVRVCADYEKAVKAAGGIDLQLLGIGKDGHIGFNEPLSALMSRTREKALTPDTIAQNAKYFGGKNKVPRRAITMGVGTILESRQCLVLVTGAAKAGVLARAVEGPVTAMVTASALQLHPKCTVVVDEAAAANLRGKDYYRWIFENEPEWRDF
jgi:glucosamine-6-phosphate deaminase